MLDSEHSNVEADREKILCIPLLTTCYRIDTLRRERVAGHRVQALCFSRLPNEATPKKPATLIGQNEV